MRSYAHLSEDERDQIGVLRAAGRSMGAIARALGKQEAETSPMRSDARGMEQTTARILLHGPTAGRLR